MDATTSLGSAEGEGRQFGDPLSEGDLEALGRRPLAVLVRAARNEGVEAWGWLASAPQAPL